MDFSLIVAPEHRPPALPVAKQLTAWRAALSSWHCPASSQRPHPHLRLCVLHGTVGGFALCLAAGGFVVRADCGSFFLWFVLNMYAKETGKQTAQKKVAAQMQRQMAASQEEEHTHTHTNRVTAPETHAWQQNNSIVGVEGEVGLQRCAGKWKQQWQKREKQEKTMLASGLRSIFKQIAVWKINLKSCKRKRKIFPNWKDRVVQENYKWYNKKCS